MGTLLDESDGAETIAMELCQSWTKMALLVVFTTLTMQTTDI